MDKSKSDRIGDHSGGSDIGPSEMMRMITAKWVSKPLFIAAELGLADRLAGGPMAIESLSAETHTDCQSLYRVLRALASLGIFSEREGRVFAMTPAAEFLRKGAMRSIVRMFNAEWNDRAWLHLPETVRTGKTAFEAAHGMPLFGWLDDNPEAARVLGMANEIKARMTFSSIASVYDFSGVSVLVDIGGGTGTVLRALLEQNPHMRGVLAELPETAEIAGGLLGPLIAEQRCQVVECDFFVSVPDGGDAYLLSNILHDWDDESCGRILSNCRRMMKEGSRLLIVEMIVPPGNGPSVAKLLDLEMMVITGGRERTEDEYRDLLAGSGFRLERVLPPGADVRLIEAFPA